MPLDVVFEQKDEIAHAVKDELAKSMVRFNPIERKEKKRKKKGKEKD